MKSFNTNNNNSTDLVVKGSQLFHHTTEYYLKGLYIDALRT